MVPADNNYYFLFNLFRALFFFLPCKKMVFAYLPGIPNHHPTLYTDPSIAVFLGGSKPLCLCKPLCFSEVVSKEGYVWTWLTEQHQEWGEPSN